MFKIAKSGAALLMGVPLIAVSSYIIKEECVYTPKAGHPWRVTITATASFSSVAERAREVLAG